MWSVTIAQDFVKRKDSQTEKNLVDMNFQNLKNTQFLATTFTRFNPYTALKTLSLIIE